MGLDAIPCDQIHSPVHLAGLLDLLWSPLSHQKLRPEWEWHKDQRLPSGSLNLPLGSDVGNKMLLGCMVNSPLAHMKLGAEKESQGHSWEVPLHLQHHRAPVIYRHLKPGDVASYHAASCVLPREKPQDQLCRIEAKKELCLWSQCLCLHSGIFLCGSSLCAAVLRAVWQLVLFLTKNIQTASSVHIRMNVCIRH